MDIRHFAITVIITSISFFLLGYYSHILTNVTTTTLTTTRQGPSHTSSHHDNTSSGRSRSTTTTTTTTTSSIHTTNKTIVKRHQHLFIDIQNVNHQILQSQNKELLLHSLLDIVMNVTKNDVHDLNNINNNGNHENNKNYENNNDSNRTLLSHHCYEQHTHQFHQNNIHDDDDNNNMGDNICCFGFIHPSSHFIFHAWPEKGVILLDFFITTNDNDNDNDHDNKKDNNNNNNETKNQQKDEFSLIRLLLPYIERLFHDYYDNNNNSSQTTSITTFHHNDNHDGNNDTYTKNKDENEIDTLWSLEVRGGDFDYEMTQQERISNVHTSEDFIGWVANRHYMDVKNEIISISNKDNTCRIDIWDVLGENVLPSYNDGLKYNLKVNDSKWLDSDITSPNRLLFLNGVMKVK